MFYYKNTIKLAALYLHEGKGKSAHYISKKLNIAPSTVRVWLRDSHQIRQSVDSDLNDMLLGFIERHSVDWFGDDHEQ